MLQALIGFASGIGVALISASIGFLFQRKSEKRRRIKETQYQVYMKLLDVYSFYFWVVSLELTGEEVSSDLKKRIRNTTWQIADLLRLEDSVSNTESILRVLMSNEYTTAKARYDEMDKILNKYGSLVNPRYQKVIKSISENNIIRLGSGKRSFLKSTTPASMGQY